MKPEIRVFSMRLPPDLHRALRILSIERRTSLNALLQRGAELVLKEESEEGAS